VVEIATVNQPFHNNKNNNDLSTHHEDEIDAIKTMQAIKKMQNISELYDFLIVKNRTTSSYSMLSSHIASAVLTRLVQMEQYQSRNTRSSSSTTRTIHQHDHHKKEQLISMVLGSIVQSLVTENGTPPNKQKMGLAQNEKNDSASNWLVTTVHTLTALSKLTRPPSPRRQQQHANFTHAPTSSSLLSFETMAPILLLLWGRLEDLMLLDHPGNEHASSSSTSQIINATSVTLKQHPTPELSFLHPIQILDCLVAVRHLPDTYRHLYTESEDRNDTSISLYEYLCHKLEQDEDAMAKLRTIHSLQILRHVHQDSLVRATLQRLQQPLLRKSMKSKHILQALDIAATRFGRIKGTELSTSTASLSSTRFEIQAMVRTLTMEWISRPMNASNQNSKASGLIFRVSHSVLDVNGTDPLVHTLCNDLTQRMPYWNHSSVSDIANILAALEQWQVSILPGTQRILFSLGGWFQSCCSASMTAFPRDINTILRCAALLVQGPNNIMELYVAPARKLFLNSTFLHKANALELSNFAWFLAFKANPSFFLSGDDHHEADEEVVKALASRILERDVIENCSPKLTCRILTAFTQLCCTTPQSSSQVSWNDRGISNGHHATTKPSTMSSPFLSDLFANLGEHLLTTKLSPSDASSMIVAYAKSAFVYDMGIFDHLVHVLGSQISLCTHRQLAQSLWACAKMFEWEWEVSKDACGNDDDDHTPADAATHLPPYYEPAINFARRLSTVANELTCKDVTQTVWAMAKLRIHDDAFIAPMMQQVFILAPKFNSQETANILWASSKFPKKNYDSIYRLTRRFSSPNFKSWNIKPQEASNVLYALGKMDIRDVNVFRNLTRCMLENIHSTSAQSVANAMWAHRAVLIEPPQDLIDTWAQQKLGLDPVPPPDTPNI
jgi:hypothetical protein